MKVSVVLSERCIHELKLSRAVWKKLFEALNKKQNDRSLKKWSRYWPGDEDELILVVMGKN